MFINRKQAGLALAYELRQFKGPDTVVLGIPRGGAETAYYVATELNAGFSILVSRKIGHPDQPEYAIGAIAEDGSTYFRKNVTAEFSKAVIDHLTEVQKKEIIRRIDVFRKGRPLPSLEGKTVILVDDGIATGATLFAAIQLCRNKKAGKIIVAAPVASADKVREFETIADEVVVLETPPSFHSVSQVYEVFYNLPDEEVLALLEKWERENDHNSSNGFGVKKTA